MSDGGGHGKRRGHEEEHEEHENHERWLVSYADMMTLLMVLFIVMFAISQVDSKKFMALKNGLSSGFGAPVAFLSGADALMDTGTKIGQEQENLAGVQGNTKADPERAAAERAAAQLLNPDKVSELVRQTELASVKGEVSNLKKAQAALQKALQVAGLAKGATFRFDERGLIVSIATDNVLFDSGSATLLPAGRRILDALAPTLRKLPNHLNIDGHTDSNPISSAQFPSNWELGSSRADGVLRYLASAHHLPFTRMTSSSFADTQPRAQGRSAAAMAADRRVEIVVVAQVDNSAGRAVAKLGNDAASPSASPSASATASPSRSATRPSSASPSTPPSTTPAEAPSEAPSETHNLLGPDPTPASTAATTPRRAH